MSSDTKTSEKPILFSDAMVRAILDGRKTQTRRIVKERPPSKAYRAVYFDGSPTYSPGGGAGWYFKDAWATVGPLRCPYGSPGDELWVRECFSPCVCEACERSYPCEGIHGPAYRATFGGPSGITFRPSIHMPRWASRLSLRIEDIRVERVQDISGLDARDEGFPGGMADYELLHYGGGKRCRHWFRDLWDSINSARGYSWESNPWVWVVTFSPITNRKA